MSVARPRRARAQPSLAEARRLALGSQGFADPRPPKVDARTLSRVIDRTGIFQIDSVNVLVRAHYMPLFSRAGAYDPALLDAASAKAPRRLFEFWAHEASLLPVTTQPYLRWVMERAHELAWGGMRAIAAEQPDFVERVHDFVRDNGPVTTKEIDAGGTVHTKEPWWSWSETKRALEWLFWSGRISSAGRTAQLRAPL